MTFDPDLAEIRFGCGLSPVVAAARSIDDMLASLTGPDIMAQRFPIEPFTAFRGRLAQIENWRKIQRDNPDTELAELARAQRKTINKAARADEARWFAQAMLRRTYSAQGFLERLAFFWSDHFSAQGKGGVLRRATAPYIEDAIRPFVTLRFADLLQSAVMHPLMLHYLDQMHSVGPNSVLAVRRAGQRKFGLNENLAREVLELHTLGVGGPYTQQDVSELAELFTGMTFQAKDGFKFRKNRVEPGGETILGKTYADVSNIKPVRAVLEDLAVHPVTAAHIARKLAVHFVSDTPDPALVQHMTAAFKRTDGALMAVYAAMLEHPSAWSYEGMNMKFPVDFMGSACRALAIPEAPIQGLGERGVKNAMMTPLAMMGQNWQHPLGPDGWPEEDGHWITPQGMSGRVRWAMAGPELLQPDLPDPRQFVENALGGFANDVVRFAASAAEGKAEAIGLVLSSPAFQRR